MPLSQQFPFVPRLVVAVMSALLVSVVGMTFALAQSSEPVSTGPLTAPAAEDGVSAGDVIEVSGSGYAPGGSVDITIESDPILLKTIRTDAAGAFVTTVTIPAGIPAGVHTLKATGPDPAGGLRVLSMSVTVTGESGGGVIPRTGGDIAALAGIGAAALLAGGGVLVARRRSS